MKESCKSIFFLGSKRILLNDNFRMKRFGKFIIYGWEEDSAFLFCVACVGFLPFSHILFSELLIQS